MPPRTLVAPEYARQGKKLRVTLRAYSKKGTGLSLPQIARLVRMYRATGIVELKAYRRRRFPGQYTGQDVTLLAEVDRAHERLSGPAPRCMIKREHEQFGKRKSARLAGISIAHRYNLRKSARYRRQAMVFQTIGTESRACTTFMPSTRWRSGRWWAASARSASSICFQSWKPCCISFGFSVFMPATARSTSTTWWPDGWRSC